MIDWLYLNDDEHNALLEAEMRDDPIWDVHDVLRNTGYNKNAGTNFFNVLRASGRYSDDLLYSLLSRVLKVPLVNDVNMCPLPSNFIKSSMILGFDIDWCIRNKVFIVKSDGSDSFDVFVADPFSKQALSVVEWSANLSEVSLITPSVAIRLSDSIANEREVNQLLQESKGNLSELAEQAPVINLVNNILEKAIEFEASDVHIEPDEKNMIVRFRVDGRLQTFLEQPILRFPAITSRIKLLSELDIAERRLPQDGRFTSKLNNNGYDIRVSTVPSVSGESIVMRLLPKNRDALGLEHLGFETDHLEQISEWTSLNNGIILVTGPTGSGKSTTLYGILEKIKSGKEKILTVEDPVEFQITGITQVQARADIDLTFAKVLRSFLRQDPDVIMVGEVRDSETAKISIQASLTGHLVLSTLHTNDAMSVFSRLSDIGVENYLQAATIKGVQAQRLVRKLCLHCRQPTREPDLQRFTLVKEANWHTSVGCNKCNGTGFRGRIGIYELVSMNERLRRLVAENAPVKDLREAARQDGFRDFYEDGLIKASKGVTSFEEVLRVCRVDTDVK